MEIIAKKEKEHIQKAEMLAWQQLDFIRHSNGYYDINDYVHFYHEGKIVVDPWISLEGHYNGIPWAFHNDPKYSVDPFEHYGCEKVTKFIEEIIRRCENV